MYRAALSALIACYAILIWICVAVAWWRFLDPGFVAAAGGFAALTGAGFGAVYPKAWLATYSRAQKCITGVQLMLIPFAGSLIAIFLMGLLAKPAGLLSGQGIGIISNWGIVVSTLMVVPVTIPAGLLALGVLCWINRRVI